MFKPEDRVHVNRSNSGYVGPGEIVEVAFGSFFLVKIEREEGNPIILVRMTDMRHDKTAVIPKKAKKKD